ncbi:MAG: hypothetical protein ACRDQ0_09575 [Pseudonocardia sp.]
MRTNRQIIMYVPRDVDQLGEGAPGQHAGGRIPGDVTDLDVVHAFLHEPQRGGVLRGEAARVDLADFERLDLRPSSREQHISTDPTAAGPSARRSRSHAAGSPT